MATVTTGFSRRTLFKGVAAGAAALTGLALRPERWSKIASAGLDPTATRYKTTLPRLASDSATPWGLRDWADLLHLDIGTDVANMQPVQEILKREFNLANVWLSWNEPVRGQPQYGGLWQAITARNLGKKTFCSSILTPSTFPEWLIKGNFSKAELLDIIKHRVEGVRTAWKGLVDTYVVCHESYAPTWAPTPVDVLYNALGPTYVDYAFQVAREYSTKNGVSCRLLYNDYANQATFGFGSDRYDQSKKIVDRLGSQGLIDGVGLELHVFIYQGLPDVVELKKAMQSFGKPVSITEFDVNLHNVSGTKDERFAIQAELYKTMVSVCLDSNVCQQFIMPFVGDKYSETAGVGGVFDYTDNDSTFFDDDLAPKPAYYATMGALKEAAVARGVVPR